MLIAQISDLHVRPEADLLCGRFDTNARLRAAIAHLNALSPQPDLVIATGDLTDGGTADEYALLREMLAVLRAPVILLRGNHDDVQTLRAAFPDHTYLQGDTHHLQYALTFGGIRIVALDTERKGTHHGGYCQTRAEWLRAALAEAPDLPTLLAMHHPPFRTGMQFLDRHGFENLDLLTDVVMANRQIGWAISGHIHRNMTAAWGHVIATSVSSTSHQVVMDLDPDAPLAMIAEPPACRLLSIVPREESWSHVSMIGSFGDPVVL